MVIFGFSNNIVLQAVAHFQHSGIGDTRIVEIVELIPNGS